MINYPYWLQCKSLSLELYDQRTLHGYVEIVVNVIIQDKSLVHVFALLPLVDKDHTVVILYHEDVVFSQIFFEFVLALQTFTSVEVDIA